MLRILPKTAGEAPSESSYDGLSLEHRDPDLIRAYLPATELFSRYYFRVRYHGLENVSARPTMFVGNHSGGLTTPDSAMTAHALWSRLGVEHPTFALIHWSMFRIPPLARPLMKLGGVAATARMADLVLQSGASLLIYPGGGDEAYRSFANRNKVDLGGRSAYVRLAMRHEVPIVPVVALGGHNTLVVLSDGERIARALRLDQFGVPRIPIVWSWPFGITAGFHHSIPFPARIDIAFGKPIRLQGFSHTSRRPAEAVEACHAHIERRMQAMLDSLVAARMEERRRNASLG
jgi:1-acyl-sn-glycerol-3-phosphate acyltransferase